MHEFGASAVVPTLCSSLEGSVVSRSVSLFVVCALALAGCTCGSSEEEVTEEVELATPQTPRTTAPVAMTPEVRAALLANTPDERAPDEFRAILETTKGPIEISVHRQWAPAGADRFYTLVKRGYFTDVAFFRVISGFMAQFGMAGDPEINSAWRERTLMDEPVLQPNTRGRITFAKTGAPNSRSTQFFINFGDNRNLDGMGFSPFGEVRDMTPVDALYSGYGEGAPRGRGPDQGTLGAQGNTYLRAEFPELDYIRSARIVD